MSDARVVLGPSEQGPGASADSRSGARSCLDRPSEAAEERSGGAAERGREGATLERAGHASGASADSYA